jgi:hypothetical protein
LLHGQTAVDFIDVLHFPEGRSNCVPHGLVGRVVSQALENIRCKGQREPDARLAAAAPFSPEPLAASGEIGIQIGFSPLQARLYRILVDLENGADVVKGKSEYYPQNVHHPLLVSQTEGDEMIAGLADLFEKFLVEVLFCRIAFPLPDLFGNVVSELVDRLFQRSVVIPPISLLLSIPYITSIALSPVSPFLQYGKHALDCGATAELLSWEAKYCQPKLIETENKSL